MIRLVNDLLQLSKMDNESDQINKEIIDFNMFINKLLIDMKCLRKIQHLFEIFRKEIFRI